MAPTHPHPNVPNEAGVRLAIGPIASLVDRMRDAVTNRGTDDEGASPRATPGGKST